MIGKLLLICLLIPSLCFADTKISQMTSDSSPADADVVPIVKNADGLNYKVAFSDLKSYVNSGATVGTNWGFIGGLITDQNWASSAPYLNRDAVNWASLNNDIQRTGVNWSDTNIYPTGKAGNVGIGTPNPGANFTIKQNGSQDVFYVASSSSASLFKVAGSGNVGVGSSNPGSQVDVQGTVRAINFVGSGVGLTGLSSGGARSTYTVCASDKTANYLCDYTATGTNDQTQINSAITAANALPTGGKVFLTEGHFYIGANGTAIVPLSNVDIQGSGMYKITQLIGLAALGNLPVINNNTATINNVRIYDLYIDGSLQKANNTWNVQQKGIEISSVAGHDDNIKVDHVWIYNTAATCLAIDAGTNQIITDNRWDTCGTNTFPGGTGSDGYPLGNNGFGYGTISSNTNLNVIVSNNICINVADACVLFEAQTGTTVASTNYVISNNIDTGSYNTVRLSGNSNATITGNVSLNDLDSSYVLTTNAFANVPYSDVNIVGNLSYNAAKTGVIVTTNPGKQINKINITGNTIDNCGTWGIQGFSNYTLVANNLVTSCGEDGIYWLSGQNLTNVKIVDNITDNNGTASVATHESGINLKINSTFSMTGFDIEGNQSTGNPEYGLTTALSAGTFSNFIVKNNDFSGNTTGSTNLTGATITVGTNFFPFGNRGYTTNYIEGNLGMGTANPGKTIDVIGTVRATAFSGDGSALTGISGSGTVNSSNINTVARYNSTGTAVQGSTILFDNGVNVGIGTLTTSSFVTVQQATDSNAGGIAVFNSAKTGTARLSMDGGNNARLDGGSGATLPILLNGAGGASAGNVGIGTSTTTNALTVASNAGTSSSTTIQYNNINGHAWNISSLGSASGTSPNGFLIRDNTAGSNRAVIDSSGNLGIGSSTPTVQLDVNGTIRATEFSGQSSGTILCVRTGGGIGYCSGTIVGIGCTCN